MPSPPESRSAESRLDSGLPDPAQARPISIWQPTSEGRQTVFVRPEPGPFDDHYSDRSRIAAHCPDARRICWLGESAAAGYLLAPFETPAKALQRYLGPGYDVVDLARTNERLDTLVETAEAAMQLRPDHLILCTGNNWNLLETVEWSPYFPDHQARGRYAAALRTGGVLEPARRAAAELRQRAEHAFARLAALRLPVTVVIPEVNLADWSLRQPPMWLPGTGLASWYRLFDAARGHLQRGRGGAALRAARRLVELDGGTCPMSMQCLADALARAGKNDEALLARRAAVDIGYYATQTFLAAPQASATVQQLQRELCARHGFRTVELGDVLADDRRRGRGAPPGRRWFYDYCHWTPEGIERAMSAVATEILGRPCGATPPAPLTPRQRSLAELGAAVHGVHRGARGAIVRHWCKRSLETWPGARQVMLDLVSTRNAAIPAVLTPAQLADPVLGLQQGWDWPFFDAEVLAQIGAAVGSAAVAARLDRARIELWHPLERSFPEVLPEPEGWRSVVFQALSPITRFAIVATGPVEIEWLLRSPGRAAQIRHRGVVVKRFRCDPEWRRVRLRLDLTPGLHAVELEWSRKPLQRNHGEHAFQDLLGRLENGSSAHLCPVFGEISEARLGAEPRYAHEQGA